MDRNDIYVNDVKWPVPAIDGIKVGNKFLLADADRVGGTMHFELEGEVWDVSITYPNLTPAEYKLIYNSLRSFKVSVKLYNPWTDSILDTIYYRGDIEITRHSDTINQPITITFTGTETL